MYIIRYSHILVMAIAIVYRSHDKAIVMLLNYSYCSATLTNT